MPSNWPGTTPSYTTKVNLTDVVDASHPNTIQDDVIAIANNLGTSPNVSTAVASTDVFDATSQTYGTLKARLANIEKGIVGDSHTQYVKVGGGSIVLPVTGTPVNLVFRGKSASTSNLTEWRRSDNTLVTFIDSNGVINTPVGLLASASDVDNLRALVYMGIL